MIIIIIFFFVYVQRGIFLDNLDYITIQKSQILIPVLLTKTNI